VIKKYTDKFDGLELGARKSCRMFAKAEIRRVDECCVGSDG
jgi:hypothetical protein